MWNNPKNNDASNDKYVIRLKRLDCDNKLLLSDKPITTQL